MTVVGKVVRVPQLGEEVVRVEDSDLGHLAQPRPVGAHVRVRAHEDAERAGEAAYTSDRLRPVVVEAERFAVAHDHRRREIRLDRLAHGHRPTARAPSAVRLRERLVQVVVDDVEAHVSGPGDPHDRVEIRTVVVEERAGVVEDPRHLLDPLVEQAERGRVREHEPGRPLVHLHSEIVEVEIPPRVGLDLLQLVARHRDACGVRPVGRICGDDGVALLASVGEVRAHEHEPGQLALRTGCGLKRHRRKAGNLGEDLLQVPHELERALRTIVLLVRMEVSEPRQPSDTFVDARVVLHRATPERVEARVDAERAIGERRYVANDLRLGDLRKSRRTRAKKLRREFGPGEAVVGHTPGTTAGAALLEDELHQHTSLRTVASRSTSSGVRFSVRATSSTSSIPG